MLLWLPELSRTYCDLRRLLSCGIWDPILVSASSRVQSSLSINRSTCSGMTSGIARNLAYSAIAPLSELMGLLVVQQLAIACIPQ